MKKILLSVLLLFATISAFSAKPLKVISGKASFLKEFSTASVVFDYSEASWEGDESLQEYCGDDYEPRISSGYTTFIKEFNRNSKGLKITDKEDSSEIIIKIVFKEFEQKQGMSAWGRLEIKLFGSIDIINRSTDEIVCSIEIDKLSGDADYSQDDRFAKAYASLAKELASLK